MLSDQPVRCSSQCQSMISSAALDAAPNQGARPCIFKMVAWMLYIMWNIYSSILRLKSEFGS
jgi:hypothetical protein